jgi:hypothetical protein
LISPVVAATDGVAVHAADAGGGEDRLEAFFALLGACAEVVEMFAIALGTAFGDGAAVSAVMTFKTLAEGGHAFLRLDGFVVGEGDGAVEAFELFSAGAAHGDEGVATAVEQDHGLFAAIEGGLGFGDKEAGEELFLAGLLELLAHVDEFYARERAVLNALGHGDELVFAGDGVLPRFEGRGGGAEDYGG